MPQRQRTEHRLKIRPEFFEAVMCLRKTFEIRKNDRGFSEGDDLLLQEFDGNSLTGRQGFFRIVYITDWEQKDGYVVFSIRPRLGA
jgi:hypothetical protein